MVHLSEKEMQSVMEHLSHCRQFDTFPWVSGPPLKQRRVAIIATSGVHMPNDRPFQFNQHDSYRVVPGHVRANDLIMSHGEATFDRTAFQRDGNIVFPIDRLREMAKEGTIGSVADFHYTFGAPMSDEEAETAAREIAGYLKKDDVNACLFPCPV